MYRIVYEKEIVKFLRRLTLVQLQKIKTKLESVAENPFGDHPNLTSLKGLENGYRLRMGNLRVVYEVHTEGKIIIVWKIGFRGSVYRE